MKKILLLAVTLILSANLLALDSVAVISASKGKVDLHRAAKMIKHKTGDFCRIMMKYAREKNPLPLINI